MGQEFRGLGFDGVGFREHDGENLIDCSDPEIPMQPTSGSELVGFRA